jgi:cellulose synthase/poly-beta-1,6-N-acetylglucosamine synthase-like glycosyltransferase
MGYVYFLYPICIHLLALLRDKRFLKDDHQPAVTIIITAYNEEKNIARKLVNTLDLDYPRDKMEIIVGSDGSTDDTNNIVRKYATQGVRLMDFPENRGKTMVQNDCVRQAAHEIIIFMDAASLCTQGAVEKLVANLADERVGAVAGRIEFVQSIQNLTTQSQGLYWRYEQNLKRAESRLGSLVGVDGPLYAIRKRCYVELEADIISDLITPLLVIRDGSAVVYEPDAVTYEEATLRSVDEKCTRERIVTRGLTGLLRYPELFDITVRPLLAWQIISHKILRWLVGFYFSGMFISALFLIADVFYMIVLCLLGLFFYLSFKGFRSESKTTPVYAIPYYFILINWSAMLGVIKFLCGKRIVTWKPVRE